MSRLCRLKTASHGDDGKWAYNEIVSLRKQRDELLAALELYLAHASEPECAIWRYVQQEARAAIESVKGEQ